MRWMLQPESPLYIRPTLSPESLRWLWSFWRHCNLTSYEHGLRALAGLNRRTIELYRSLSAQLSFQFATQGIVAACSTASELEETLSEFSGLDALGLVAAQPMTPDAVAEVAPSIRAGAGGVLLAGDGAVDPVEVTSALARFLRESGAAMMIGEPVEAFDVAGDRVSAVRTRAETVAVDGVLIAAGALTGRLLHQLGFALPLQAGRGYSFDVAIEGLRLDVPLYFHRERVGLSPLGDRIRAVGTMELGGFDEAVNSRRLRPMINCVRRWFPHRSVEMVPNTAWAGLRPMIPDGLPALGRVPGWSNAFVATGHSMLGMTLGPSSGDAMADLISSGVAPETIEPFDPVRFGRTASRPAI
jgi:D-amino-acid dehydrogenase